MRPAVVWMIDGNRWSDRELEPWLACLSHAEQHRYHRFIRPLRQREFLIGRILLRFAVARLTDLAFDDVSVIERKNNSPLPMMRGELHAVPNISLSHSQGWVACAASADMSLGLDIEMRDGSRDLIALSQSVFSASENNWLSVHSGAARVSAFYALWSAKEALYKFMSNADILTNNEAIQPEMIGDGGKLSSGHGWYLKELAHPLLSVILCAAQPLNAVIFVELTRDSPFDWTQQACREMGPTALVEKNGIR
ncbi:4'-phosphopantetheinyl transferase superfamily protein [Glaciimonas sp. PCH181]|uniref:4'-phosphopantetheinyl transferase family protein n=1 Tax=Glaciimonas sp. PCH181 TaxID=2133943 RepID=UPI000D35132A|nr:4'-phosphopantetheinyl transferase superfamily protein [Glaciimonas sp. PCH181]PUA19784.1 hypothetical protein C7W93_08160 [Glaciimonas sp. PCH181]